MLNLSEGQYVDEEIQDRPDDGSALRWVMFRHDRLR